MSSTKPELKIQNSNQNLLSENKSHLHSGFEFEEPTQLSFDQLEKLSFQAHNFDFTEARKLDLSYVFNSELEESKTSKFMGLSVLAHAILILMASLVTIPLIEKKQVETITIDLTSGGSGGVSAISGPSSASGLLNTSAKDSEKSAMQLSEKQSAQGAEKATFQAPEKATVVTKNQNAKALKDDIFQAKAIPTKKMKAARKSLAVKPKASKTTPQVLAPQSPVIIPETLDDIKAPVLDEAALKKPSTGSTQNALAEKDFADDFDQVDQKNKSLVGLEQERIRRQAEDLDQEQMLALNQAQADLQNENKKMIAINQSRRDQEKNLAKQLAQAEADQVRAQAEARAREQAQVRAQEQAQARAAALAAAARAQQEQAGNSMRAGGSANEGNSAHSSKQAGHIGSGAGTGSGVGSSEGNNSGLGSPVGQVRVLEDLRQMPGNPKPQYDSEERLNGQQGSVKFLAYITKDGRTSDFRLLQSTGYRNLDGKTLAALKKWRFYPGQEGWVEIPIQWNLKGGVSEKPTLLRRSSN